jgi:tetratricopeptide (TPR) repeat protein
MASLIPGYEYDIFISYRQKDNKGDRWVNKFVDSLKAELEATFKDDVTVYFDENPHDRLQETYDVGKSLEGKLKCLIFIPILSQTYCDPNSYAWRYEFQTFLKFSSEDQFGRNIKLRNGNVASRVFPVRIHDLEAEDVKLYERETGSVLRTLDFVFKTSSGVNRPLKSFEDHPTDNLNKTFYADQINKAANALKEIISVMKADRTAPKNEVIGHTGVEEDVREELKRDKPGYLVKSTNRKLVPGFVGLILVLCIAVILLFPKIFNATGRKVVKDPDGKISIAVNTFDNLTGDTSLNWMRIGLPNIIRGDLGNIKELSVQSTTTMNEVYQSMKVTNKASMGPSFSRQAALKLNTGTYLTGSFQKMGNKTLVQVELNDTKSGIVLMSDTVEGILPAGYKLLSVSLSEKIKNYLEIKAIKEITSAEFSEAYTTSAEAYRKYIEGMQFFMNGEYKASIESFKGAFKIDSTFTLAAFYIANANNIGGTEEEAVNWTRKAYTGKEKLPKDLEKWVEMWYAYYITKNPGEVLNYCSLLEKSDIKSRYYWYDIAVTYSSAYWMWEKAVSLFDKIEKIDSEWGDNWKFKEFYRRYGDACHLLGRHEKEAKIYETGLKLFPDEGWILYLQARCAIESGDTAKGTKLIDKLRNLTKEQITSSAFENGLGGLYSDAKSFDKAEEYYRISIKHDTANAFYKYNLAKLLFEKGKNLDEGLKLINISLHKYPLNAYYLWTKGTGLYKMGRFKESLDQLKKGKEAATSIIPILDRDIQMVSDSVAKQR